LSTPVNTKDVSGLRYSLRAFRHRNFSLFWSGAIVSNAGSWISNLTIPYVIFQMTGSALWVGLVAVFQFVPQVVFGPWGGILADRHSRRTMLFITQAGLSASAFLLWAVVTWGPAEPLPILLAVLAVGIFNGLNMPIWQAFVYDLVLRDDLTSAVALNSLQFNAGRAVGPAVAGLLIATVGPSWALLINALSFATVIGALALIRLAKRVMPERTDENGMRLFAEALRYIPRQPGIVVALFLSLLIGMFVNPVVQMTVVFAGRVFEVGPAQLGIMTACMGVGALLAAPIMAGWGEVLGLATLARGAILSCAVGLCMFALAPNVAVASGALVLVGGGFLICMSSSNTAIQMIVANRLRGRVIAVRIMTFMLSIPIGATMAGLLADAFGPRISMLAASGGTLLAGIVLVSLRGKYALRRMDDPHDSESAEPRTSAMRST
jgi:MFS family permease